jgi:hypothetical protein
MEIQAESQAVVDSIMTWQVLEILAEEIEAIGSLCKLQRGLL